MGKGAVWEVGWEGDWEGARGAVWEGGWEGDWAAVEMGAVWEVKGWEEVLGAD